MKELEYPKVMNDIELISTKSLLKKKPVFLIGSRKRDRVMCLSNEDAANELMHVFKFMNGDYSIKEIEYIFVKRGLKCDVPRLVSKINEFGLLENHTPSENNELNLISKKIFFIPFKTNINEVSQFVKFSTKFYLPCMIILMIIAVVLGIKNNIVSSLLNINFKIQNFMQMSLLFYFSIALHELGHIIVARAFKIKIEGINISLKWGILPIIYIKYQEINFLSPSIKARLLLGGIGMNLFIVWTSIIFFVLTNIQIFLFCTYVNMQMIIKSLYPQTLSDGYYLMILIFNKSSIRLEALKWIFSREKTKLTFPAFVYVVLYILITILSLILSYAIMGNTIKSICLKYNIEFTYVAVLLLLVYALIIIRSIQHAKKRIS